MSRNPRASAIWLGAVCVGCGAWPAPPQTDEDGGAPPPPPGCFDIDGDGFGVGVECAGPDCDDSDPSVHTGAECDVACYQPGTPGCPCTSAEPIPCYTGPPETLGQGTCRAGIATCDPSGTWGPCNGEVLPGIEFCDERDNDCDAEVDEGVTNECGTCAAECARTCFGVGFSRGFAPDDSNSVGVTTDVEGALVLSGAEQGEITLRIDETANYCWDLVTWEASTPDGAEIAFDIRTSGPRATTPDWLRVATEPPDASPADLTALGEIEGETFELRTTLSPGADSPRILTVCIDDRYCDKV